MNLTESVVKTFSVAKIAQETTEQINSIDYFSNGLIFASSCNESLSVYDCHNGSMRRSTIYSKKYGIGLIKFTHDSNFVLHGSTKVNDSIRLLSIEEDRYDRYFSGHSERVTSLSMCPSDDIFLSGSLDKTIRLWDKRILDKVSILNFPLSENPIVTFDPEGTIFIVGSNSENLELYDLRYFEKGPFITFNFQRDCHWTGLKCSPSGTMLLVSTNGQTIKVIDTRKGEIIHNYINEANNKGFSPEASFSPDSQFVFTGSSTGKINCWSTKTGRKIKIFDGKHKGPVNCVQFNPKFMMFTSTCSNVNFWLPQVSKS